jgi:hypothetical protein
MRTFLAPAKVGESSEWTSIVNCVENKANFCKGLDGKPLFSTLKACTR